MWHRGIRLALLFFVGKAAGQCVQRHGANGPFDMYLAAIDAVSSLAACEAICTRTPACTLYKYCSTAGACKNTWAYGGYESEVGSCVLGSGGFSSREAAHTPSIQGFTIGMCVPDFAAVPSNAIPRRLHGFTVRAFLATDAAECEEQCTRLPECNGYNFCFATRCGEVGRGRCELKHFGGAPAYVWDEGITVGAGWLSGGLKRMATVPVQEEGQLAGIILIMDVNSITVNSPDRSRGPMAGTPSECAQACIQHPKCNTWTFCTGSNCGPGCSKKLEYNSTTPLDYTRFGVYKGCVCSVSTSNGSDCLWPGNMCTLKFNVGDAQSINSTQPWVSGVV